MDYERWYSFVYMLQVNTMNGANPNPNGALRLWVNGTLLADRSNLCITDSSSATIDIIEINGTIAQGAYDAPAHYRKFDAFMLTDNWQNIINGGYLRDSNQTIDTIPPAAPSGLAVN